MPADNVSESIKRVQGILNTLERQLTDLKKAESDMNRLKLMHEKLEESVAGTRHQLEAELAKMDPDGFAWILVQKKNRGELAHA